MKVGKLDLSYKMMELHKQLSTMATIVTVHGDIILDDELQALVYMALRPVLEKRLKTGALAPVFVNGEFIQDGTEKQLDLVEEIDREYTAGAGEVDKAPNGVLQPPFERACALAENSGALKQPTVAELEEKGIFPKTGYVAVSDAEMAERKYVDPLQSAYSESKSVPAENAVAKRKKS